MLADGAVLAFGSERSGLTEALLRRADGRFALPMRPGVSSLNLAAAAAAVLYAWRLGRPYPVPPSWLAASGPAP
jgi:TrmH family RNA methyltransferase